MKSILIIIGFLLLNAGKGASDVQQQKLKGHVKTLTNCQCPIRWDGKSDQAGCIIYVFRYNEQGNQIEDNDYVGGTLLTGYGKLNHKRLYKYDLEGNQTEVEEYDADGNLNQKVVYTYNESGLRTERRNYTAEGSLWRRSVFGYDSNGNRTECTKYDAEGTMSEDYTYAYDLNGNIVLEQHILIRPRKKEDGVQGEKTMDYVKTFVYDDAGQMTKETDNMGRFRTPLETDFKYENYDAEGNWLKQITIEDGKQVSVTDRIIDYYQ